MENISGFYRVDGDGNFQQAPNFVYAPTYELHSESKDQYTYPTEGGWYWFDTLDAACTFFGIDISDTQTL